MRSLSGRLENEPGQSSLLLDLRDFVHSLSVCARGQGEEMLAFVRAFDALADRFIAMGPEAMQALAAMMPKR